MIFKDEEDLNVLRADQISDVNIVHLLAVSPALHETSIRIGQTLIINPLLKKSPKLYSILWHRNTF
jgi:hypothetical protein